MEIISRTIIVAVKDDLCWLCVLLDLGESILYSWLEHLKCSSEVIRALWSTYLFLLLALFSFAWKNCLENFEMPAVFFSNYGLFLFACFFFFPALFCLLFCFFACFMAGLFKNLSEHFQIWSRGQPCFMIRPFAFMASCWLAQE